MGAGLPLNPAEGTRKKMKKSKGKLKYEDSVTITINQAAKILGVVPATIRNWEKNGLIAAKRSPSNYRIFTPGDVELLLKIKELSHDKHMSAEAIKLMLNTENDAVAEVEDIIEKQKETLLPKKLMSEKWREIRLQQGYTLKEVSDATGISIAHLSNLENGGNVSLDLMGKLADFYRESPVLFIAQPMQDTRLVRKGTGEPFRLKNDPGIQMTSLVSMKEHVMYPVLCTVEPGCGGLSPHTHNGEEFIYLFSGVLEYRIEGEDPYIIHPGDSFYHKGSEKHSWQNISTKPAKLLWVHSAFAK